MKTTRMMTLMALLLVVPMTGTAESEPLAAVRGTVVNAARRPLTGAECSFDASFRARNRIARTDRNGRFGPLYVRRGRHMLTCRKSGYYPTAILVRTGTPHASNVLISLRARRNKNVTQAKGEKDAEAQAPVTRAPRPTIKRRRPVKRRRAKRKAPRVSYGVGSMGASGVGYGGGGVAYGSGVVVTTARGMRGRGRVHGYALARKAKRKPMYRRDVGGDREGYDRISEKGFVSPTQKPLSTVSIDVDTAAYSNVRRFANNGRLPPRDAVRIEELVNYFDYNYPGPRGSRPFAVHTEVSTAPWNRKHRLVHIGLQGKRVQTANLPANNLVFLIDVSGSMHSTNKLPLLKNAFSLLVDQLREQDRVSIVVYAGAAGVVLPPTHGNEKGRILRALYNLRAGGSTAGGAGIKLAYQLARKTLLRGGNNRVVLATDGDFNVGTSSDGELTRLIEKERDGGIFLTVLGFGTGNYQDAKMQKLADKGNGHHAYIDSLLEAQKVLVREMGATLLTIAKDVKVQIEFNPARVKGWRLIGYENRVMAARDFADDKKDAGELGAGHSVTFLYELIPTGSEESVKGHAPLRYQARKATADGGELMHVKLRYKAPRGKKSKLITQPLIDRHTPLAKTSNAFRFAAAVTEVGLVLRGSKHKGRSSLSHAISLASGSVGADPHGDRHEFLQLASRLRKLDRTTKRP